jgi:hypothetical protein
MKPINNKLLIIKDIIKATHVEKQVIQENNFKKNFILNDGSKALLIERN